ncbi:amidohydrolase [Clostridium sp. MSJ-11]|uniref:Amidohydrolase n=1 Tax=Clostridium mobile TaxID=2841512 RepID=A0ABS6EH54_9CLOT|nr:M20 family metallopeptidase [Clostridium mobile]MBU5484547.1 amidohydrolase [Clostridium mobile]
MKIFYKQVEAIFDELVAIRRRIHQNPELGLELPNTIKTITKELDLYNIEYEIIENCGILAHVGKNTGKTIMLRADMDALPMAEETNLSFKSQNENVMHSCGHDIHATMLLGAAIILKQNEDQLNGYVKLLFQPDEEGLKGARLMIKSKVLENPRVDAVLGIHVVPGQFLDTGTILGESGAIMAGSTSFDIKLTGKGGHGSSPENTIDPIYAAVQIYQGISSIKTREIDAQEPLVLTIGEFSFGKANNVIPHSGSLAGTIRFFHRETGEFALRRVEEIATSIAQGLRVEVDFKSGVFLPPVVNDEQLTEQLLPYIKEEIGEEKVKDFNFKFMSSEDFAFYGEVVPTLYLNIGAGSKKDGYEFSLHHHKTLFDENVIKDGISSLVASVFGYLNN